MKSPPNGVLTEPFFKTMPSWMGVTEMLEAPTSMTRAVGLPDAKPAHTADLAR
jgi:hypothetical protein